MTFDDFWKQFTADHHCFAQPKPIKTKAENVQGIARMAYHAGKLEAEQRQETREMPDWLSHLVDGRNK